jgi:cbb3-type cytochrome oxidase subunit 1
VVPLAIGGVAQGHELQNPSVAFMDIVKATLPFLRTSTMGELLLLIGHVIFIGNIAGMVCRLLRARASAAYTEATADLFQATEVRR